MYRPLFYSLALLTSFAAYVNAIVPLPDKFHGVNIGSWLVIEPWMIPGEWVSMGGQICDDCLDCISSEFTLVKSIPDTADEVFAKHWASFLTQEDVNTLKSYNINSVRIPMGYWIIEALVDRRQEYYARGGLDYLRKGLKMFHDAGIAVILDHHALPGVSAYKQQFAGHCTPDVEFYTPYNYHRALVWTAVMTALSHLDPAFASVAAIEAVNEPLVDPAQTPGYGDFQKNFAKVVRAVELILGMPAPPLDLNVNITTSNFTAAMHTAATQPANATKNGKEPDWRNVEVAKALVEAVPILLEIGLKYGIGSFGDFNIADTSKHLPVATMYMDANWQSSPVNNPADAAMGPALYDNHLYYSFGGVANATEKDYLTSICNLHRVEADAELRNTPLVFGEWGLPTQWNATDEFYRKWGDAQKIAYNKGKGWIYWNFKVEIGGIAPYWSPQWSYMEAVKRNWLPKDATQFFDGNICDGYQNQTMARIQAAVPQNTKQVEYRRRRRNHARHPRDGWF